jgi:hypothetical protein
MTVEIDFRKSSKSGHDESCGGNVGDCVEVGRVLK